MSSNDSVQSKLTLEHKEEVGGLTGGFIEPTDRFTRKEILQMVNQLSQTRVSIQVVSGNQTKQDFDVQSGLQLPHCNLSGLDLRHLWLKRANFTGSNLEGTKFDEGRLESATFEWANLRGARFVKADLKKANLKVSVNHQVLDCFCVKSYMMLSFMMMKWLLSSARVMMKFCCVVLLLLLISLPLLHHTNHIYIFLSLCARCDVSI